MFIRLRTWWDRKRTTTADNQTSQSGFTIVETTVAMSVVFVVLTGTLATFGAGVKNMVNGRQRTAAVSVARGVIEEARAGLYSQIGHDLSDPTLDDDPDVSGSPPAFEGEQLVGLASPIFTQHRWDEMVDGETYTVEVYVTWVTTGSERYKRITVEVAWQRAQYDTAVVDDHVRMSSFLFAAGVPPDPLLDGVVTVDGGTTTVAGTLADVDLERAVVYNPSASGTLTSLFTREAAGNATSASATVDTLSGTVSGCDVDSTGQHTECSGIRAETTTDSDTATAVPEHDEDGPRFDTAHSVSSGSVFDLALGANDSVDSESTSRSCHSCFSEMLGDDDRLAHHWSEGAGPDTVDFGFDVGPIDGSLIRTSGNSTSTATLDQDEVSSSQLLTTTGRLQMPAVDVLALTQGPSNLAAAVHVGAVDVTVEAQAGPTAASPSVSGDAITVDIYDTLSDGSLGYRTISVNPGEEREETASVSYDANGATVSFTTTVISGGKSVANTTDSSGNIDYAEASLTNWLRIQIAVVVTDDNGTIADSTLEFDYGRLSARAQYEVGE